MKKLLLALTLWSAALPVRAQDPRERVYNYEILKPSHEAKPPVEGFATERIRENLGRSLTARPAPDGRSVHLSWRLCVQQSGSGNVNRRYGAFRKARMEFSG